MSKYDDAWKENDRNKDHSDSRYDEQGNNRQYNNYQGYNRQYNYRQYNNGQEEFNMNDFTIDDGRIKTTWIDNSMIVYDSLIQRNLETRRVGKIARHFNPYLFNPIKVSARDGYYYVFDGQHTLAALRMLKGNEDFKVECRVYYGLTREDEARLFAQQNGYSEKVSMPFRLRALNEAKDPVVMDFIETTESQGFLIEFGCYNGKNGRIAATCEAYASYRKLQKDLYSDMLNLIKKTWGGVSWSVTKNMLQGMTVFMKMYTNKYGERVDVVRFIKALRDVDASDIRSRAKKHKGMALGTAYGIAIAGYYEEQGENA